MKKVTKPRCTAIFEIGDKPVHILTFQCDLPPNHRGSHKSIGYDAPYQIGMVFSLLWHKKGGK